MTTRALTLLAAGLFAFASVHAAQTAPKPLETVSPGYPAALNDTGLGGAATIDLVVKADGTVADARVKSADHEAFGQAALMAVQKWKFEPATVDGAPVDKKVTVPFNFVAPIAHQMNAKLKRRVFQPLTEPVLSLKQYGK